MTQQAVSANIRMLENQLGTALFVRSTRSVSLTTEGETLLARIAPIVNDLDQTMRTTALEFGAGPQNLRIEIPPGGAGELMPILLWAVSQEFPDVQLELLQTNWASPFRSLEDGSVDLALLRMKPNSKGIHFAQLLEEPTVLAVSNNHPLSNRNAIALEDILDEPFVVARHSDAHWEDFWLLNEFRKKPVTIGARADSFTEELEAVAVGLGVSLVPALVSRLYARPDIRFLTVANIPQTPMYLAWSSDSAIADRFKHISEVTKQRGKALIDNMSGATENAIDNLSL